LPPRVPTSTQTSVVSTSATSSSENDVLSTKKSSDFLNIQNKNFLKNNYAYKMLLVLIAFGVCLYLTKKYWWKYIVQKFFPSDLKKVEPSKMPDLGKFSVNNSPYVKELKESDAKEVLGPSSYVKIVMIYANWCHHCEVMMPAFEEAAKLMNDLQVKQKTGGKIAFMRAEAMSVPSLANRPSVPGFPTVVGIFQNGKEFPYMGPRSVDSLLKFAELVLSTGNGTDVTQEENDKPRKVNLKTLLANSSQQLPALPGSPNGETGDAQETKIDSSVHKLSNEEVDDLLEKKEVNQENDEEYDKEDDQEDEQQQDKVDQSDQLDQLDPPDTKTVSKKELDNKANQKILESKASLLPLPSETSLDSLRDKKDSESSKQLTRKKNLKL